MLDRVRRLGRRQSSDVSKELDPRGMQGRSRLATHSFLLMAFVLFVMLFGGSSRLDASSLMLLRPVAILVLAGAITLLPQGALRQNRGVLFLAAAIVLLPVLQLVPLPPQIWQSLQGRELIVQIDASTGIGNVWRPLTLSPAGTWNALYSLSIPGATLLLGLTLSENGRRRMVPFVLALILLGAALGVLQVAGPRGSALYFYRVTHADSAVGFFANRNHQAAFLACGFPILGFLASDRHYSTAYFGRPIFALLIGALLIPLVMITGSRMGLVVAAIGLALGLLIFWAGLGERNVSISRRELTILAASVCIPIAVALVTVFVGRAEAVSRLLGWDNETDVRFQLWSGIVDFAPQFWPWGTGFGSFAEVYKVFEPADLLNPKYFNQAHNDWLEVLLTGGLPAAILLVVAVCIWLRRVWKTFPRVNVSGSSQQLARTGLSVVLLIAIASITDYPLRVPFMASIFLIAVLWSLTGRSVAGDA